MKKLSITLSISFLLSISFTGNLTAQTEVEIVEKNDSIVSEKGNLALLVERIFLANKAYKTGVYGFNDEEKKQKARQEWYEKNGIYSAHLITPEQPVRVAVIKEKEEIVERVAMKGDEVNEIPTDSIRSIELIFSHPVAVALYGPGAIHQLVIKVKD